jgi:hypothetical protein
VAYFKITSRQCPGEREVEREGGRRAGTAVMTAGEIKVEYDTF